MQSSYDTIEEINVDSKAEEAKERQIRISPHIEAACPATTSISTDLSDRPHDVCVNASVSIVIPLIKAIKLALNQCTDDSGIQTMKPELLDDINTSSADITTEPFYAVATLVDRRH